MTSRRPACLHRAAVAAATAVLLAACGGGAEVAPETSAATSASPTSTTVTTSADGVAGGYEVGGYRLDPVEPGAVGFDLPAGTVTAVTAFRVSKDGREVAVIVQAFLPETETPSEQTLLEVLAEVTSEVGGTPVETSIGEGSGYVVTTADGKVVVASLQEDASLRFAFGTDESEILPMLEDLSTAQPGAS